MIQQRHTIGTPAGRIVIQASATGASVQVAFFPADNTKAPCGFLIPNASAGIVALAVEAVATINEESSEPELPDSAHPGAWTCYRCGFRGFWAGGPHDCEAEAARAWAERRPEVIGALRERLQSAGTLRSELRP